MSGDSFSFETATWLSCGLKKGKALGRRSGPKFLSIYTQTVKCKGDGHSVVYLGMSPDNSGEKDAGVLQPAPKSFGKLEFSLTDLGELGVKVSVN